MTRPTLTRRTLLATGAASLAAPAIGQTVVRIPREYLPTDVTLAQPMRPGVIHVDTANTWLYYTLPGSRARRYKIAVGAKKSSKGD